MWQDEGVAFLLTESQIVDERMLVLVNDLLASGEVPGGWSFALLRNTEVVPSLASQLDVPGCAEFCS